jgi:deoxyxylulose-5-phosphate synthase
MLCQTGFKGAFRAFGVDDRFVPQGTVEELLSLLNLDVPGMVKTILNECSIC